MMCENMDCPNELSSFEVRKLTKNIQKKNIYRFCRRCRFASSAGMQLLVWRCGKCQSLMSILNFKTTAIYCSAPCKSKQNRQGILPVSEHHQ